MLAALTALTSHTVWSTQTIRRDLRTLATVAQVVVVETTPVAVALATTNLTTIQAATASSPTITITQGVAAKESKDTAATMTTGARWEVKVAARGTIGTITIMITRAREGTTIAATCLPSIKTISVGNGPGAVVENGGTTIIVTRTIWREATMAAP